MNISQKITIFLVDDDALFLRALEIDFLQHGDLMIETFTTGESCVRKISQQNPDIIILDYQLDGIDKGAINGIETLDRIKAQNPKIPVIMLSSQDKIEVAIDCMHHGAVDYVVKSESAFMRLQSIIDRVFKFQKMEKQLSWYMERMG
jgi:two-component system, OmpR family, response regulator